MQMVSVMLTPIFKDAPMMSLDYIYVQGKRKAYIEFLNLDQAGTAAPSVRIREFASTAADYKYLKNLEYESSWQDRILTAAFLKAGTASDDGRLFDIQKGAAGIFLNMCGSAPGLDPEQTAGRTDRIRKYYRDLISKGGIATDVFRKSKGEEWTEKFFTEVFFGTN